MPSHQPSGKIFRRSWSRANYSLRSVQLQIFSHSFFFCVFCCFLAVFRALLLQMDLDQEKESNQVALKASSKANSEITLKLEAAQAEYKQLKEVRCMRFLISLVAALTIQTLLTNHPVQASALEATKAAKMVAPWFLVIYAMVDISWHFSLCEGFQGAKRSRTFTQAAGDFTVILYLLQKTMIFMSSMRAFTRNRFAPYVVVFSSMKPRQCWRNQQLN